MDLEAGLLELLRASIQESSLARFGNTYWVRGNTYCIWSIQDWALYRPILFGKPSHLVAEHLRRAEERDRLVDAEACFARLGVGS